MEIHTNSQTACVERHMIVSWLFFVIDERRNQLTENIKNLQPHPHSIWDAEHYHGRRVEWIRIILRERIC